MNMLIRLGAWIRKAIFLALAIVCLILVFWGMLYKLFLAFTPLWLDEFTIVASPLALAVLWLMNKSTTTKLESTDKDAKPVRGAAETAGHFHKLDEAEKGTGS